MPVDNPDKCKYFDLAQLVKERANADGVIVIILKGNDSRIAPDLPPELQPVLARDFAELRLSERRLSA